VHYCALLCTFVHRYYIYIYIYIYIYMYVYIIISIIRGCCDFVNLLVMCVYMREIICVCLCACVCTYVCVLEILCVNYCENFRARFAILTIGSVWPKFVMYI